MALESKYYRTVGTISDKEFYKIMLFKFVNSLNAVINMAKGSLKFTPLPELNDPSEMSPVMDGQAVRASLELLRSTGFSEEQYRWLFHQDATLSLLAPGEKMLNFPRSRAAANRILLSPVYDDLSYMEKKLFATIELIRSRIGILSLTQRYDSLPMWAHYADQAKGFVVVFNNLEHCFSGDNTGSLNVPKPVAYYQSFKSMTFDPSTQDLLFFSKLADWSYEREWRVVRALDSCRQTSDGKLYLCDVNPRYISGVICGWRVSVEDRQRLQFELNQLNPPIDVISSALVGGKVNLDKHIL